MTKCTICKQEIENHSYSALMKCEKIKELREVS
jgi:hypothetical protein